MKSAVIDSPDKEGCHGKAVLNCLRETWDGDKDALRQLSDVATVVAYDISTGWP